MFVEASDAKVAPPSGVMQNEWGVLLYLTGDNAVPVCNSNIYKSNFTSKQGHCFSHS